MRTVHGCINCGDEREIVAHGLCSKCYMARRREREVEFVLPHRSQKSALAERNKEHGRLVGVVKLVDEVECLSDHERQVVKAIIQPHLVRYAVALVPAVGQTSGSEPDSIVVEEPREEVEPESTVNDAVEVDDDFWHDEEYSPRDDSESTVNAEDGVNVNSGRPEEFTPEEAG